MHLIIRGIGRQTLFEDRRDRLFFLNYLRKVSSEESITVIAYCLMDNHVHLLVQDLSGRTSRMMSRLETTYARYYNQKYDRVGHLFQNRYKNENIENAHQLLNVFRYILNNPVKAGLGRALDYEWSSGRFYDDPASFADVSLIKKEIGDISNLNAFLQEKTGTADHTDITVLISDEKARALIKEKFPVESGYSLNSLPKEKRDMALHFLKQKGLSIRQIERLTGIGRNIIQRA